jgi:hypothetical protein
MLDLLTVGVVFLTILCDEALTLLDLFIG